MEANMDLNKGKQERKYFSFMGHDLRIDMIPSGISIPFTIEIEKARKMALMAAEKVAMSADKVEDIERLTIEYFAKNPQEAQKQLVQTIKAVSVLTEFLTDGEITEDKIKKEADANDVNDFMIALQEAINAPLKKQLERMKEESKEIATPSPTSRAS